MRQIVIFLLVVLGAKNLFATAQDPDKLIVNGDTVRIFSNPLEAYLSKKGQYTKFVIYGDTVRVRSNPWEEGERTIGGIELTPHSTGLWRGYVATWRLENDSLFLVRLQKGYENQAEDFNIRKEFGTDRVFAGWVTETIIVPQGKLLQYVHAGYGSLYEGEKYYEIKGGKLINTKDVNFVERDDALLFPSERFLYDTIRTVILNSIDSIERASLDEKIRCTLLVSFNEDREISYVGFYGKREEPENINEKIILENAKEALKGFPKLMIVNNKRYYHPTIKIHFYKGMNTLRGG